MRLPDSAQLLVIYQKQQIQHQKLELQFLKQLLKKIIFCGKISTLDLDEILIPLGIVEEEGRLPLKRGPKVLQENGMPYYRLTKKGLLVALSISDTGDRDLMMNEFFAGEYYDTEEVPIQEMITKLQKTAPKFTFSLFEKYTKAYCDGKMSDLLPFNLENLQKVSDSSSHIQMELLEGFVKMSNSERNDTIDFLKKIE